MEGKGEGPEILNGQQHNPNFIATNKKCEKVSLCDYQDAAIDSADVAQRCRRSLDFERRFSCNMELLLIFLIGTILRTQSLHSVPNSTPRPNISILICFALQFHSAKVVT